MRSLLLLMVRLMTLICLLDFKNKLLVFFIRYWLKNVLKAVFMILKLLNYFLILRISCLILKTKVGLLLLTKEVVFSLLVGGIRTCSIVWLKLLWLVIGSMRELRLLELLCLETT